ncbi:MAG: hypothetical protein GY755_23450 [Chloroflexi bacterium]|nr:hypothetical protein [Chloroflexota bacterium]
MSQILQWLTSNPLVGMITLITFLLIVISVVVIYLVAFFQGQEISFWPPQISQKPETIVKNRQIVKNKEITTIQFCDDFWKKTNNITQCK